MLAGYFNNISICYILQEKKSLKQVAKTVIVEKCSFYIILFSTLFKEKLLPFLRNINKNFLCYKYKLKV